MGAASMKIWCSCCSSSCCDGGSDMLLHAIWMVVSSDIGTAVWIRANGKSCGLEVMEYVWFGVYVMALMMDGCCVNENMVQLLF